MSASTDPNYRAEKRKYLANVGRDMPEQYEAMAAWAKAQGLDDYAVLCEKHAQSHREFFTAEDRKACQIGVWQPGTSGEYAVTVDFDGLTIINLPSFDNDYFASEADAIAAAKAAIATCDPAALAAAIRQHMAELEAADAEFRRTHKIDWSAPDAAEQIIKMFSGDNS